MGRDMATDRLPATLMSNAREQHDGEISSSPRRPRDGGATAAAETPHHPDRFCPAARPQRRRRCDGRALGPRTNDHAVLVAGVTASSANDRRHRILLDAVPAGNADPLAGHVSSRAGLQDRSSSTLTPMVWARDASGCRVISAELAAAITSDPEPIASTCTTLASRPAPSGSAQVADVGFISLRELIVLRSDVTAARMRSRSVGRDMDRSASARAVAAA
jgi:hypothetical protein